MDGNYIKICRSLLDWEWFKNPNTLMVYIYCLLRANWKDGRFEGMEIPRGSFVTSIASMSKDLELTPKMIRTALNHLKRTNNVAIKTTNKFSVITVIGYDEYQREGKQKGNQRANKGQTKGNNRRKEEDISKDISSVITAWNELGLSQVRQIAPGTTRYTHLQARIKEHGVDGVLEAIAKIPLSDFLQGGGDRGWVITLDWLVKSPDNFQKVLEGVYTEPKKSAKKKGGTSGYKLF